MREIFDIEQHNFYGTRSSAMLRSSVSSQIGGNLKVGWQSPRSVIEPLKSSDTWITEIAKTHRTTKALDRVFRKSLEYRYS